MTVRKHPKRWHMYPSKHDEVAALIRPYDLSWTFRVADNPHGVLQEYETSICGVFRCHNDKCSKKAWASGHVCIAIRRYPANQYNARVYFQRCVKCNFISEPTLDNTYAERIAYRIKVWSGTPVDKPPFRKRTAKPHHKDKCEGCKAGRCQEGRRGIIGWDM